MQGQPVVTKVEWKNGYYLARQVESRRSRPWLRRAWEYPNKRQSHSYLPGATSEKLNRVRSGNLFSIIPKLQRHWEAPQEMFSVLKWSRGVNKCKRAHVCVRGSILYSGTCLLTTTVEDIEIRDSRSGCGRAFVVAFFFRCIRFHLQMVEGRCDRRFWTSTGGWYVFHFLCYTYLPDAVVHGFTHLARPPCLCINTNASSAFRVRPVHMQVLYQLVGCTGSCIENARATTHLWK